MRSVAAVLCVLLIGSACGGSSSSEIEALEERIEELEDDQTATSTTTSAVASTTLPVSTTTSAASTTTAPPTTAVEVTTTTTEAPTTTVRVTTTERLGVTVRDSLRYINKEMDGHRRERPSQVSWRPWTLNQDRCEWKIWWTFNQFRPEDSAEIEVHLRLVSLVEGKSETFARVDPKIRYDNRYEHIFNSEHLWVAGISREDYLSWATPFIAVVKVLDDGSIDEEWSGSSSRGEWKMPQVPAKHYQTQSDIASLDLEGC